MKYEVVIWWSEEDEAYLAEVPELPGCMADGRTHAELLANLETVVALWIEAAKRQGQVVP
jgi:predicted RNase H-like HicB family nuclease